MCVCVVGQRSVGVLLLLESRCAFGWLVGCERCLGRFSGAVFVECEEPPWWCAVGGCDCWAATSGAGRRLGRGHPCRRRAGVVRGHVGTRAGGRLRGLDLARPSSSEFGLPASCTRACAMRRRRPAGDHGRSVTCAAVASRDSAASGASRDGQRRRGRREGTSCPPLPCAKNAEKS